MGKKGKKAQAGKPKKLTPKDVSKRLDALVKKLEEELKGADLFAPLPPMGDCVICCLPLSRIFGNSAYNACCQKWICTGCDREHGDSIEKLNEKSKRSIPHTCPFCRAPEPTTTKEYACQLESRALQNDGSACVSLGEMLSLGEYPGVPEDKFKALELYIRAAEIGSAESRTQDVAEAYAHIADYYKRGILVPQNFEKAKLFDRMAAVKGSVWSRHGIGLFEYYDAGNHELGIRHWKIAAEGGSQASLNELKSIYFADGKKLGKEFVSKEYLDKAYRMCHAAQEEVKSEGRKKDRDTCNNYFNC